jgi:hypothetical protein
MFLPSPLDTLVMISLSAAAGERAAGGNLK